MKEIAFTSVVLVGAIILCAVLFSQVSDIAATLVR